MLITIKVRDTRPSFKTNFINIVTNGQTTNNKILGDSPFSYNKKFFSNPLHNNPF